MFSESYKCSPQGTEESLSSFLSLEVTSPNQEMADPQWSHSWLCSGQASFSSQLRFLYICLTLDSVKKVLSASELGEKIPIKHPPKILAKFLKMNGIQSFFEVLNGCDIHFPPPSISEEAEAVRCVMLCSHGSASWACRQRIQHLESEKTQFFVRLLATHSSETSSENRLKGTKTVVFFMSFTS